MNAAKAQNKFEEIAQKLDFNYAQQEKEKGKECTDRKEVSKTITKIYGQFKALEDISGKSAAKEAESGKAANCFRREAKSHLMVIRPAYGYEPLEQRELVDCDCSCKPLATTLDNNCCNNY